MSASGSPDLPRSVHPGPFAGFFYPFKGIRFITAHPRLISYVAIPVGINTLLFTAFAWFIQARFDRWLEALVPTGEGWYWVILYYVLAALFAVLLLLGSVYAFTLVGNLILAPFNDLLSEKVELLYVGKRLDERFRLGVFLRDLGRSFKAEIGRLLFYGSGFLLLLSLNLFPPLGTALYALAIPLFTFFFLGWEYLDFSMERWRYPFARKRQATVRNLPTLIGFGAGASLLLMVPFFNLAAIPACVAGGTLLFCDLRSSGRLPQQDAPDRV